jgi:hypothetical protein
VALGASFLSAASTIKAGSGSAGRSTQSPEPNQSNNSPATIEAEVTFFDISTHPGDKSLHNELPGVHIQQRKKVGNKGNDLVTLKKQSRTGLLRLFTLLGNEKNFLQPA